jgi:KDO2-lipid IV(A) lauroyltransferase
MWQRLKLFFTKTFFYFFGYLPLPVLHSLGYLLGSLLSVLPIRVTYYMQRNIELCFPELSAAQRKKLFRQSCREMLKTFTEMPTFWVRSQQHLLSLVKNQHAIKPMLEAVEQQRGVVMLGMHLGGYYLKNAVFAKHFPEAVNLFKAQKGVIGDVLMQWRDRFGGRLVTTTKKGVLVLYRHLLDGGLVGVICDHNVLDFGNAWVPLFGITVPTTTLPAKLAAKSQAPVFMVIMERLSWARGFKMHVLPLPDNLASLDAEQATLQVNHMIENVIRRFPTQNEWHYRRFWDRPKGEPPLYKTQEKQ